MFREYLVYSVTSVQAPIPHGKPRGSGSHGHRKVSRIHVERNSMPVSVMRQGKNYFFFHIFIFYKSTKNISLVHVIKWLRIHRNLLQPLDLFPIKPIIGRNTQNMSIFSLSLIVIVIVVLIIKDHLRLGWQKVSVK